MPFPLIQTLSDPPWNPRHVVAIGARLNGATAPYSATMADGTEAVIKRMGSWARPQGGAWSDHHLVSEWVCARLARWFELDIPDFAILPDPTGKPCFASRFETVDRPWSGNPKDLEKLPNIGKMAGMMPPFDTLILNFDRYDDSISRYDNLLVTPEGVKVIDHGFCLMDVTYPPGHQSGPRLRSMIQWAVQYGNFPGLEGLAHLPSRQEIAEKFRVLPRERIECFIAETPAEWHGDAFDADALADLICGRARWLADRI